jgi:hypothetical protein
LKILYSIKKIGNWTSETIESKSIFNGTALILSLIVGQLALTEKVVQVAIIFEATPLVPCGKILSAYRAHYPKWRERAGDLIFDNFRHRRQGRSYALGYEKIFFYPQFLYYGK